MIRDVFKNRQSAPVPHENKQKFSKKKTENKMKYASIL
jgi:hypothetical protein